MKKHIPVIKEFLLITLGVILVAAGGYFFKFPNNFITGGVVGISLVLGSIIQGISPGAIVVIINVFLLLIGFSAFGRSFGIKTVYGSLLLSGLLFALERLVPLDAPLTGEPFLELIISVLLPAVGSAILFNNFATSGGTDIIAMLLRKYTSVDIGQALFFSDIIIVASSFFVFDVETGIFSVFGLLARVLFVNSVIENLNLSKYFIIITDFPDQVCEYIKKNIKRGATSWKCSGAFSGDERTVVLTAMSNPQAVLLKKFVKGVDAHAFMLISNTSNIIGKGFREV
ncbi:MAG: YitT family protein [Firmicutes bacterium]|nr:YitT family protein [Bacillota bacterium]